MTKSLLNYKGVDLIEEEVLALKKLEKIYENEIYLIDESYPLDEWDMGPFFKIKSHHVDSIMLMDPLMCYGCTKFDAECRTCEMKSFFEVIACFKYLRTLFIFFDLYHDLETLPQYLKELKSLEKLTISGANLTKLPEFIGEFKHLRYLNLSGNKLTELPQSIGNLESLERLILNNNRLSSLPDSFVNLKALKHLDLSWTDFEELPEMLKKRRDEIKIFL